VPPSATIAVLVNFVWSVGPPTNSFDRGNELTADPLAGPRSFSAVVVFELLVLLVVGLLVALVEVGLLVAEVEICVSGTLHPAVASVRTLA